ncbi:MAG TPA: carboxypeptidase regulatory-like domain-containing protein [Thermoanaerobaculia bacterium]|nr:carboxypeptidase regulatory-like domain-containing protein [Thermoanaerobaculia bacterium]
MSDRQIRAGLALTALLLAAAGPSLAAGKITGTIKYEGRVPNLRPLSMDADPACAAKHTGPVKPELLVLGEGDTLANVMVRVIEGLPGGDYPAPPKPAVLDQKGCQYTPHVMGVVTGQQFKVLNSDGLLHNVHSLSQANPPFNKAMPATVTEADYTFAKEERFRIKCDVHPWMGAFVTVMDHPFFGVSGNDGKFTIDGLPPGTYTIEAWHEFERFPAQTATVTIAGDETKTADFTFQGPSN